MVAARGRHSARQATALFPVRRTLAGDSDSRGTHERRTVADLLYVAIMIAVFAVLFLLLKGVERIER